MKISDDPLPKDAELDIHPDAMVNRPELSVGVAYAVAIWADIEARLDGIFLGATGDEEALREFQSLKGWDRRAKFFVKHVKAHQGENAAIGVKAILATVAVPARKRNELAHGIWAVCPGVQDALVLLPHTAYLDIATDAKQAEAAGSARVDLENDISSAARLVRLSHLQELIGELHEARNLIHTFMIETFPETVLVYGRDELPAAVAHPQVASRIKNAETAVRKRERAKGKPQRQGEPLGRVGGQ